MKKFVLAGGLALASLSAHAQFFTPESFSGAAFGAIAGGIIGHNNGRHGGEGAAIGAGAGWLIGSLIHQDRRDRGYYSRPYGYYDSHYSYAPYGGYYRRNYVSVAPVGYYVTQPAPQPVEQPAPQPAPIQNVTIINNNYSSTPASSMSGANALFGR